LHPFGISTNTVITSQGLIKCLAFLNP